MSIGDLYRVKKANLQFQWETVRLYYKKSWRFTVADLFLGFGSMFFNPYRICRKKGCVYGETPPSSLHRIVTFCEVSSHDCWLELGSGRGKGCMWISQFVGCRTIGIEKVALFIYLARAIQWLVGLQNLSFIRGDLSDADFSVATCVYLYSTCMSEDDLAKLAKKMIALPEGAKVISVSAPLPETPHLRLVGSFPLVFPWGETEGYMHIKNVYSRS